MCFASCRTQTYMCHSGMEYVYIDELATLFTWHINTNLWIVLLSPLW